MSNWKCPYCNQVSTKNSYQESYCYTNIHNSIADGVEKPATINVGLLTHHCPNPECLKFTVTFIMDEVNVISSSYWESVKNLAKAKVLPLGATKVFPSYVPSPILNDYKEACLIRELSPKSSATLARRCLQGMIRDVWNINEKTLAKEIEAIKDKIETDMWDAIDSIRKIGNIGAHMEKDINVVVDVDPDEAQLLIHLLEMLIQEWYVERHNKKSRLAAIKSISEKKQEAKKS